MSYNYAKPDARKIAMPGEGEVSTVLKMTDPSYQEPTQVAPVGQQSAFGPVPDELPEETRQAMQQMTQDDQVDEEVEDAEEEIEEVEEPVQQSRPAQKAKSKDDNFVQLRLARERAEREKQRAEQERDALMSQLLNMQSKQAKSKEEPVEDYEINIGDDDLAAGKDVRKVNSRTKALEKRLAQYEAQTKEMAAESRVRAKCPDIDSVITDENIYLLRQNYPDVAESLSLAPDGWDKMAAAYTMIKSLGIHKTRSYESDKMAAIKNVKKPRPMTSISPQQGESPLSGVNAFVTDFKMTKEAQKNTWKEMQEAMKRA